MPKTGQLDRARQNVAQVTAVAKPFAERGLTCFPRCTMPAWTNKDERQYEHIKEGYEKKGMREDKAQEIAARTVNKERREEGRTPNTRTEGTGNPRTRLESRSRDELENRARELGISGAESLSEADLIEAIREQE
jgi:plasmid stabilization system protein ParE